MPYTSTIRQDVDVRHEFPVGAQIYYRGRPYMISQVRLKDGDPVYLMTNNKDFPVEAIDARAKLKPPLPEIKGYIVIVNQGGSVAISSFFETHDDAIEDAEESEGLQGIIGLYPDGEWRWM